VSNSVADWSREAPRRFWDPPRRLLRSIRRYQSWASRRGVLAGLMKRRWVLSHRFWSVVTGADIPLNSRLGGELLLIHPNGIVVHPDAEIGPNCLLFQQVTIGSNGPGSGVPILEGHVDVGAGAKILGGVRIGHDAKIGANAVVISDVAPGDSVGGIPARVLKSRTTLPISEDSR